MSNSDESEQIVEGFGALPAEVRIADLEKALAITKVECERYRRMYLEARRCNTYDVGLISYVLVHQSAVKAMIEILNGSNPAEWDLKGLREELSAILPGEIT